MARIEKTVFISYRRKDISWALAVYQYLTSRKYDVFFDYTSIPSGDFEQIIVSNIKARAHFILILTPTALDRCNEPGDWLKREIETAIDEKRNIIPLFFDGFSFGLPSITEKLIGKLSAIKRYNGLDIPSGYFLEAMERLRTRYLNVPLHAVIHPVPTEVQKVVKDEQIAANQALIQKREYLEELVKPADDGPSKPRQNLLEKVRTRFAVKKSNLRPNGIIFGILLIGLLGIASLYSFIQNNRNPSSVTPTQAPTIDQTATVAPNPAPTLGINSTRISDKDGMVLLYVPEDEFTMGSDVNNNEKPVHSIYLEAFWIDKTEVTNSMYDECVKEQQCDLPKSLSSFTRSDYFGNSTFNNYPVIYVSWHQARNYCEWAGRRLPTEAEWEKAARGIDGRTYPWGDEYPTAVYLNFNRELGDTAEVFDYLEGAGPYGALNMAGNVWEWVSSLYRPYPYNASDGRENVDSLDNRVIRGGAWNSDGDTSYDFRSAYRSRLSPEDRYYYVGFRCAVSASQ